MSSTRTGQRDSEKGAGLNKVTHLGRGKAQLRSRSPHACPLPVSLEGGLAVDEEGTPAWGTD